MTAQCSGGGASRCWLCPSLRSVLGFVGGAEWLTVSLVLRTAGPHLYLLHSATGPVSHGWAERPDQGARSRPKWPLDQPGREIKPTFSPLISTYIFDFRL
jgi:hypothetical protein